jgi:large subunit ribosomal protein L21
MYAIIRAGGKQHKVAKGDVIEVERIKDDSKTLEFVPILVVDDKGKTRSAKSDLAKALVTATVLGEIKGPKIEVYKYKNKSRYSRHTGHRQKYTSVQISDIKLSASKSKSSPKTTDTEEVADGS